MLARAGRAFDSDEHLFEIKWDGFRAQALIEASGYRLLSRRWTDFTPRYTELAFLRDLPGGIALDGELVVLRDGKPHFETMLTADHAPVSFVAFDVMYVGGVSIMDEPLAERRKFLTEIVSACSDPRLVLSDGLVGDGKAFFATTGQMQLEGMVAKRLDSRYEPGERTGAWQKIKHMQDVLCAILGYVVDDEGDLRSLIIATNEEDGLRYVGKVGSGLTQETRAKVRRLMDENRVDEPLVPCDLEGRWVAPGLYCKVRYVDRTSTGMLRAPVFRELITDA